MNCNRRNFLSGLAMAVPGLTLAGSNEVAVKQAGKPLKVCVFSDLHFEPGVFVRDTPEYLETILARAEAANCDMIIHVGDFQHNVRAASSKKLLKIYDSCRIPTYGCLGNHDQDGTTWKETCEAYRMPDGHYSFDRGGFRFVVLDPNYSLMPDGKVVHHEKRNYGDNPAGARINYIPPEQLEWLRDRVVGSPLPCVILSHQSFERPESGRGVINGDAVRAVFAEANARRPGTVRLALNGHMHTDYLRVLDDVLYWEVNSAHYHWYNKKHAGYPEDFIRTHTLCRNVLAWKEPLSAILTLSSDGGIRIDGTKTEFLFDVTPEKAGLDPYDANGRRITAEIQSVSLKFDYT